MSELPLRHVIEYQRRRVAEAADNTESDWLTLRQARAFALSNLPNFPTAHLPAHVGQDLQKLQQQLEASAQLGLEQPDWVTQSILRDQLLNALDMLATLPRPR